MKDDAQASTSIWMKTTTSLPQPRLNENIRTDVCIVGGGIAGMTTAYLLSKEGRSVVVLDDGEIGGGMTGRTTAHLTNAYDDRYAEIERLHGEEGSRLVAESHTTAIDKVQEIVHQEAIDCDFERLDGFLFSPLGESPQLLEEELAAAHRAGLVEVDQLPRVPDLAFETGPALRFPRQAQFHPLYYLRGLAEAVIREGGQIFPKTHVTKVDGGSSAIVETDVGAQVGCEEIVIATNTPVND